MAKLCSHCGAVLLKDDALFCSHCGSLVRSRAQSSNSARVSSTRVLPHIKAPDQGETLLLESKEEVSSPQEVQEPALLDVGDDTPAQPFAAISPLPRYNLSGSGDNHQDSLALRQGRVVKKERVKSISEDANIIPVSEYPDLTMVSENVPACFTQSAQEEVEQQELTAPVLSAPADQEHMSPSDAISLQGIVQSNSLLPAGGPVSKCYSRFSLWLAVLLVALIIVGGVSWLLILLLAPNTNPWQSFSDTKLGFSVQYPTDWLVQVDSKQSIVHFHDSTQTGKIDIAICSGITDSNIVQFLQQQASQLGMTNVIIGPSRSFAGTSWQQVQGKLSQEGVSYSVTLLATMHGNRLYLLTQSSPQSTYNDEETLIFSMMRAGLRFS